jgi:multiple sugar transport system substrate-binding protein
VRYVRRAAVVTLTIGLALAGVAACTATPGTQAWPAHGTQEATITILSGADTSASAGDEPVEKGESGMYQELVDWWNKFQAPVRHFKVQLDVVPGGATVVHSEMLAAAETGDSSYDIYNLDNEWVPEFAADGYIRSLQGRLPASGFLAKPLASGEDPTGRLYAAPFTTDVGLLYYRDDLVSAAEAADLHSFTQVMGLAEAKMRKYPGAGLVEGYVGQFAEYEGLAVNVLEIIRGYDRDALAANGTIQDSGAVQAILQQLASMFSGSQIPYQELNFQEPRAFSAFATGGALFMRNWPIYYEQLTAAGGPGRTDYVAHHFAVAPLPFPTVLGGQDLAISADSRDPDEALQVIEFLTSVEAQRCLFAVGGFPATRLTAYAADNWLPTSYGEVRDHPLCGDQPDQSARSGLLGKAILHGLQTAIPRPVTRYYTEFSTVIQDAVWPLLFKASQGASPDVRGVVATLNTDLNAAAAGRAPPPP